MAIRNVIVGAGAVCVALSIAFAVHDPSTAPPAQAADIAVSRAPRAAILATYPGAEHTSLFLVDIRNPKDLAPATTFAHLPDATVRGVIAAGSSAVFATADTAPTRDKSFNASLYHLRPHTPPEQLVDRVVHASRPVVTSSGRVFVSRGKPGPELEGRFRVDELTIDEIDPITGQARTVHQANGYLLYLVGSTGKEIVVYRIFPNRADIVVIDPDTSKERIIVKDLPPYARDFSLDALGKHLVFQNRHETDSRTWVIERVEMATAKITRMYASPSMTLAPFMLPNGGILFNPPGRGLSTLEANVSLAAPLGFGVDIVAATTSDSRHLAALHTQPSAFAVPFIVDTTTGAARALPAPPNARIEIVGFVGEGGAQ